MPCILHTKFHGKNIDSTLSCRNHIEQLISKLRTACYVIRSIKPVMSHTTLIAVYYSLVLFHYELSFIILGNSYSCKIFWIQKRVMRSIMRCSSRDPCQNLFKKLNILLCKSQKIFSVLLFLVHNKDQFVVNSDTYCVNTRQSINHNLSQTNLATYQKGVYYLGFKFF
jgi:hypothetical protein